MNLPAVLPPVAALASLSVLLLAARPVTAQVQPRDIAGLRVWLKADAGITTEDNSAKRGSAKDVVGWADQSGRGSDVAPAFSDPGTRPELIAGVPELGGMPALEFDGKGGGHFEVTDALLGRVKEPFNGNRSTVFLVAKMDERAAISPLTLSATADSKTGRGGLGIRRGGNVKGWFCVHYGGPGNGAKVQSTEPPLAPGFHILAVNFDKPASKLRMTVDGNPAGESMRDTANLALDDIRFIQIGGHGILDPPGEPGSEWYFGGQIAEIVVFDRILTNDAKADAADNEFNAVGHYLQAKYGLKGAFVKPILAKDTDRDGL